MLAPYTFKTENTANIYYSVTNLQCLKFTFEKLHLLVIIVLFVFCRSLIHNLTIKFMVGFYVHCVFLSVITRHSALITELAFNHFFPFSQIVIKIRIYQVLNWTVFIFVLAPFSSCDIFLFFLSVIYLWFCRCFTFLTSLEPQV